MTATDYIIDIVLIAIVIRQIRESRLDLAAILLPLGLCTWAASHYLDGVPLTGSNGVLVGVFTAIGIGCGVLSGMTTRVRTDGGTHALIKAGWIAAGTWVASMSFRFAFALWAAHGGGATIARFSADHGIDSAQAWTAALILMALGEVFVRTGLLVARGRRAQAAAATSGKTLVNA